MHKASSAEVVAAHHRLRIKSRGEALKMDAELNLTAPWTVLYGPSGSGKSSILRAFCGLMPTAQVHAERRSSGAGTATVLESRAQSKMRHQRRIAYAPQLPTLFPHMTVRQNLAFAARASEGRVDAAEATALVNHCLQMFRLNDLAFRKPEALSGGEQQRVNLGRAFAVPQAELMLLDEPFNGMGPALRDELLPAMQAYLLERNVPVLSVTHQVDEALQLGADVYVLHAGHVVAHGPANVVLAEERRRLLAHLGQ